MPENSLPKAYDFKPPNSACMSGGEERLFQTGQRPQPARVRPVQKTVRHFDPARPT